MTAVAPSQSLVQRLRRLQPYFAQPVGLWVLAFFTTAIGALTEPAIPELLRLLVDQGFQGQGIPLWSVPAAVILLFGVRGVCYFLAQMALARIANNGVLRLRSAMFERVQSAEMALFSRESASSMANTVVYEVQNGSQQLTYAMLSLAKDSLTIVFLLSNLFYRNWRLTLIVLLLVPAVAFVMTTLSRRLYRVTKASQAATDQLAYVVEENILAHRSIRLHNAQAEQLTRFQGFSQALRRLALKSTAASAAMTPLTQMLGAIAMSTVITIALWESTTQGTSIGSFVAFVTNMLMLLAPVKHLADVANPITRGLAAVERGLDLIEHTPSESSGTTAPPAPTRGQLDFEGVTVTYPGHDTPALRDIHLHIAPGENVAFVGPSGSGKTTLMNLLPRFVLPHAGSIALDGLDCTAWPLQALRSQIAMVSQDVVMLNDSIAANVALGQAVDATRVAECLVAANLGDYVRSLAQGMETVVGHNATQLSGGQRQRLAIARALYKNAPLLILDEATSALDNESERLVQEALQRVMKGRTTLIVAHRMSTIEHADRIVVMAEGRIAEQGTHQALLQHNGLYARLHQLGFPSSQPPQPHDPTL